MSTRGVDKKKSAIDLKKSALLKKVFQLRRAIAEFADEYVEAENIETQDEKSHSKVQNLAETHV